MKELIDTIDALKKTLEFSHHVIAENFSKDIADIVTSHSAGAAASALASGWIPGAGAGIATTISAGFIWSMYARINSTCQIPFSENVMKSLASGLATNLVSYILGGLAMSTLFSFFPGVGSIGASVIIGGTCYALTLASGIIYLKILTKLMNSGVDLSNVTEEELKAKAADITQTMNIKETLENAKKEYKNS
jgi:hypothetical protein